MRYWFGLDFTSLESHLNPIGYGFQEGVSSNIYLYIGAEGRGVAQR